MKRVTDVQYEYRKAIFLQCRAIEAIERPTTIHHLIKILDQISEQMDQISDIPHENFISSFLNTFTNTNLSNFGNST